MLAIGSLKPPLTSALAFGQRHSRIIGELRRRTVISEKLLLSFANRCASYGRYATARTPC